jgi:hypothetical protein
MTEHRVGKHKMKNLNEKLVAGVKRIELVLVVVWFVVVGSQTAVHGQFLGQKGLGTGCWGQ